MRLRWLPIALGLTALALATPSGADVLRTHSNSCAAWDDPAIAFDGTNFLVAWTTGSGGPRSWGASGVCGTRVSRAGAVRDPGAFTIAPLASPGYSRQPSVAFGDPNHLVVWTDHSDVYGNRVSPQGAVLDQTGLRLTSLPGNKAHPALAFDGTNYLVVWKYDSPGMPDEILGVFVTPTGEVLRLIHISSQVSQFFIVNPVVAFDGTNFLVAWEGSHGCALICAARVSPSGIVLDQAGIPIISPREALWAVGPAVASDGTNSLVVWHGEGRCGEICAARVSSAGTVLDPGGIPIGRGWFAAVTFAGGNYLVAWQLPVAHVYELYGARVSSSGTVLDPSGIRISRSSSQGGPAVAFDGTNSLVVWLDGGIQGARVSSAGRVLDASPIPISNPPPIRCVVPRVVGLRLARAKARIRSANCRLGRLRRARSTHPGRVLGQSPRAGAQRPRGTRVNLVIGVRRR